MRTIFPNLRRLKCACIYFAPEYFPKLDEFAFGTAYKIQDKETVSDMLHLNPQLRTFKVGFQNFSYLKFLSKHFQSIENLTLYIGHDVRNYGSIYSSRVLIELQNVKKLEVTFLNIKKIRLPLLLNQLKGLTIRQDFNWNDSVHEFFKNHQSIVKITFQPSRLISSEAILMLLERLPLLQSIEIDPALDLKDNYDTILKFFHILALPISKKLKKFTFYTRSYYTKDFVESYCAKDWLVVCVPRGKWNFYTLNSIEPTT